MSNFQHDGLRGGIWHGVIEGESRPAPVALVHRGERIGPVTLTQMPDGTAWQVAASLPLDRLTDGASTFLLVEDGEDGQLADGATIIARLPVVAGAEIASDLQAELALMRAEIDLLLREFRRQAVASATALQDVASRSEITVATAAAEEASRRADAATAAAEEAGRKADTATGNAEEAAQRSNEANTAAEEAARIAAAASVAAEEASRKADAAITAQQGSLAANLTQRTAQNVPASHGQENDSVGMSLGSEMIGDAGPEVPVSAPQPAGTPAPSGNKRSGRHHPPRRR